MPEVKCKNCSVASINLMLATSAPSTHLVSSLPFSDFLIVTWTKAETGAMATVFGNGTYFFDTETNNNFTPLTFPGLTQADQEQYNAFFFQVTVDGKSVICLKSNFHPKVQTAPTSMFFERLVGPTSNRNTGCLITSGTSGGIWSTLDLGDVVVTNQARYGMTMPIEKQSLNFTGLADIVGSSPNAQYANWFDYINDNILRSDTCVNQNLASVGGRAAASGAPTIYYSPSGNNLTDVVTNSRITDDECGRIATYRTLGATLDENDAYVAEACQSVLFSDWVSIRNISDLPCASSSDDQYDTFQYCSSLNGAYAVWAFIMGH